MNEGKIKWGILGPGIIAQDFAEDFAHIKTGEVISVASRSKERSEEFARKHDIINAYGSYEELYNDPEIDIIYIATPHNFHFEQASSALKAGKGVLCEKPITISSKELIQLRDLSKQSGIFLMEGMWTYFLPAIQMAQQWIDEGRIGKILHIKSDFGYPVPYAPESRYYNPALAGGTLYDMGIYNIAMPWLFLKDEPQKIKVTSQLANSGVDKDTLMFFEYTDTKAMLHCSFQCKLNNHTYIIGENGYIDIPDFWRARTCYLYQVDKLIDSFDDKRKGNGFEYEIEHVNSKLLNHQFSSDIVPFETSLIFQKQLETVQRLSQTVENE